MRAIVRAMCISGLALAAATAAHALPLLESPVPLPANFEGVITIYPDSDNSVQVRRYWLVPSTARIVRNAQTNQLEFGMVHSGLTVLPAGRLDPDGVRGLLTLTVQPYVDNDTLNRAKQLIEQTARTEGATSVTFSFITPREMKGWLMVGGQPSDFWGMGGTLSAAGGTVEAGYVFQIRLQDRFDIRALTQAGGDAASTVGARFTMKFDGMTNPCRFTVRAKYQQLYEHYKAQVNASGWFGLVRANASAEWKTLKENPFVTFENRGCSDTTIEKYYALKLIDSLLTQLAARSGQFAPVLKPSGLPDAPGGGGLFGWSFNAGGGYERVDEERDIEYSVNIQSRVEEEMAFGFSFPTASNVLKPHMKNLTDTAKPLPTSADIEQVAAANETCIAGRIAWLRQLHANGAISQDFFQKEVQRTVSTGCAAGPFGPSLTNLLVVPPNGPSNLTFRLLIDRDKNERLIQSLSSQLPQ
jgi:hypothetical protein